MPNVACQADKLSIDKEWSPWTVVAGGVWQVVSGTVAVSPAREPNSLMYAPSGQQATAICSLPGGPVSCSLGSNGVGNCWAVEISVVALGEHCNTLAPF
jgi:hypothetical protein